MEIKQKKLGSKALKSAVPNAKTPAQQIDMPEVEVLDAAPTPAAKQPKKAAKPVHQKFVLAVLAWVILLAAGIGLFNSVAHQSLTDIYVGAIPVKGDESQASIQAKVADAAKTYLLQIQDTNGKTKRYLLPATGVAIDVKGSAASAKKQIDGSLGSRLTWWRPLKIDLQVKINDRILRNFVSKYATRAEKPAKNASIVIDNGQAKIKPEVVGYGRLIKDPAQSIKRSVATLSPEPLKLEKGSLQPLIMASDLSSSQAKIEKILGQKVVMTLAGQTIVPTKAVIGNWLDLSPVPSAKTIDVTINSGKVLDYIDAVAAPYVQPPRNRLVAKLDSGLQVIDPGADGIDVYNKDKTAADIAKKLSDGKDVTVDLSVRYAAATTVEVTPYDKWFVADTTTKRMYAYEKTKLVRTFLISAGAPLTPTVTGTFKIYAKYVSQDMRGANADGSRYFQPDVPYVNYFYGDYAIHGNYWRPLSWFGNINSSHGCIGVTVSDGAWIYNWAPIGTTVIVHA